MRSNWVRKSWRLRAGYSACQLADPSVAQTLLSSILTLLVVLVLCLVMVSSESRPFRKVILCRHARHLAL